MEGPIIIFLISAGILALVFIYVFFFEKGGIKIDIDVFRKSKKPLFGGRTV